MLLLFLLFLYYQIITYKSEQKVELKMQRYFKIDLLKTTLIWMYVLLLFIYYTQCPNTNETDCIFVLKYRDSDQHFLLHLHNNFDVFTVSKTIFVFIFYIIFKLLFFRFHTFIMVSNFWTRQDWITMNRDIQNKPAFPIRESYGNSSSMDLDKNIYTSANWNVCSVVTH